MKVLTTSLVLSLLLIAGLIWAIGVYLAPDDLAQCSVAPSEKKGCEVAGAIVAVSGGDTTARAEEAIKLYKNGWAPHLIFSGAAADKSGPSNAEAMQRQAIAAGVPAGAIMIETASETTEKNAVNTAKLLREQSISSIILVTSPYHQRRAMQEFKKQDGLTVRSHPSTTDKDWSRTWFLSPYDWSLAGSELVKSFITGSAEAVQK